MAVSGPSYAADVKPLFREQDRRAMTFLFDLWAYEDVRANAADILSALEAGEMPCDGPWPPERVDLLRRWIDEGLRP